MSRKEIRYNSHAIIERLKHLVSWGTTQNVHCFSSLPELNEVDTHGLFQYLWRVHPHVNTYTTLRFGKAWKLGTVKRGAFVESLTELPKFDVIIVPMLGFDSSLHRLGYGVGFYDRFLATQIQAKKIGVCYEWGRTGDRLPSEAHDVALDCIVTEQNIWKNN